MHTDSEILETIRHVVKNTAMRFGLNKDTCNLLSSAVEEEIRIRHGGNDEYIHAIPKEDRYKKIRLAYDGTNRNEVIQKFNISIATFYNAIRPKK